MHPLNPAHDYQFITILTTNSPFIFHKYELIQLTSIINTFSQHSSFFMTFFQRTHLSEGAMLSTKLWLFCYIVLILHVIRK